MTEEEDCMCLLLWTEGGCQSVGPRGRSPRGPSDWHPPEVQSRRQAFSLLCHDGLGGQGSLKSSKFAIACHERLGLWSRVSMGSGKQCSTILPYAEFWCTYFDFCFARFFEFSRMARPQEIRTKIAWKRNRNSSYLLRSILIVVSRNFWCNFDFWECNDLKQIFLHAHRGCLDVLKCQGSLKTQKCVRK